MSIVKYSIRECKLNTGVVYRGKIKSERSIDLDGLIKLMAGRGSTLTTIDIKAVLCALDIVVKEALASGYRVSLGDLARFFPTIEGIFKSETDSFNHNRHKISFGVTAGPGIKNLTSFDTKFQRTKTSRKEPFLRSIHLSQTMRELRGPVGRGTLLTVKGRHLQFDAAVEDEGVFLQPWGGEQEIRIKTVADNRFSRLIFILPESIPQGSYILRVVSRMGQFDKPRYGTFIEKIIIE